MLALAEFHPDHVARLLAQPGAAWLKPWAAHGELDALREGPAFTGYDADGRVLGCAGVLPYWSGRGEAWALLDHALVKPHFRAIHLAVRRFLTIVPLRRIEASVDAGFANGHRWVRALGFTLEAASRPGYRPDGGDCALYALVKGG